MIIYDAVYVVNGQLRTADGECWPHPFVSLLREFGVEDGEYPVELEMIAETRTDGSTVYKTPTRLIIHFDQQLDQSA